MTKEFQWNNQARMSQAMETQTIQSAPLKTTAKEIRQGGSVFPLCLQTTEQENQLQVHDDIQPWLEAYADVSKKPTQLPPAREAAEPVKVRPYSHAYFFKS